MAQRSRTAGRTGRHVDAGLLVLTFALALGTVAGFFGDVLPLFDTIGHFRAHASLVLVPLALLLIVRRYAMAGLASLATAALGLQAAMPFMLPAGAAPGALPPGMASYTLLQMNLRYDTEDKATTLRRITEIDPDVVTVQEITGEWSRAFHTIAARYPYQDVCAPPEEEGDAAILSRRPFVGGAGDACNVFGGFLSRGIDFDGKTVVVGSQHLRWPWPGRQWRQLTRLAPDLAALGGARLIGGDFNAAPWSAALARYAGESRTRVASGIGPTWGPAWLPSIAARFLGLPIDNILVSEEILILSVARPEATASDHLPVLVTFALPFAPMAKPDVQSVSR